MNKQTLYRLFALPRMIERKQWEVQRIWDRLTALSSPLTGMPHAGGAGDKIGEGVAELVDKKRELEEQIRGFQDEEKTITQWIDGIGDLQVRLIIELRFKDKLSWREVAAAVGGNNTEDSVRKMADRYLERTEE